MNKTLKEFVTDTNKVVEVASAITIITGLICIIAIGLLIGFINVVIHPPVS